MNRSSDFNQSLGSGSSNAESADDQEAFSLLRSRMVEYQIRRRGIHDARVLNAMLKVPRHRFVPQELMNLAYDDSPLSIGYGQTISQPYIVGLMTEMVRPQPEEVALEIGTGCGYQTAVLAELVHQVYSMEIVKPLAIEAQQRLSNMGYHNIQVRYGDGYRGWLEHSPFDMIVVTAAPDHLPPALMDQLSHRGRMIIPVGRGSQDLILLEKQPDGQLSKKQVSAVRFVPMTGEANQLSE